MPGFDGTGPSGQGPMTGGGRGECNSDPRSARKGLGRGTGPRGIEKREALKNIIARLDKLEKQLNKKI